MSRRDFKPGQLAWVTKRYGTTCYHGRRPCSRGWPAGFSIIPGVAVTIVRRALVKDYGTLARHTYKGVSQAARLAANEWLVIHGGVLALVDDRYLCKRQYTPRKKPQ